MVLALAQWLPGGAVQQLVFNDSEPAPQGPASELVFGGPMLDRHGYRLMTEAVNIRHECSVFACQMGLETSAEDILNDPGHMVAGHCLDAGSDDLRHGVAEPDVAHWQHWPVR